AVAIGYAESFIPFFLPGMRLGLANIIIVIALYELGAVDAAIIDLGRVLLVNLLRGTFLQMGFFMSLAGAALSLVIMILLKFLAKPMTPVGVSAVGGVAHSFAQVAVGSFFMGSLAVFYYFPVLELISLVTGVTIGLIVERIHATGVFDKVKARHGLGSGGELPE
ncbi:MAG: Gx transporter family protein, partial [Bacilli bacterium]|nr:Gx transporter family protein [Bacilli bacterium]